MVMTDSPIHASKRCLKRRKKNSVNRKDDSTCKSQGNHWKWGWISNTALGSNSFLKGGSFCHRRFRGMFISLFFTSLDTFSGVGVQTKGSSCSIPLKILLVLDLVVCPFSVRLSEIRKKCIQILRLDSELSGLQTGIYSCLKTSPSAGPAGMSDSVCPKQINYPPTHPLLLQSSIQVNATANALATKSRNFRSFTPHSILNLMPVFVESPWCNLMHAFFFFFNFHCPGEDPSLSRTTAAAI